MSAMVLFICCLVTFCACLLGTICGMGGGIIIKPVLDAVGVMSVATISFLSGCTVVAMSCWNVGKSFAKKESVIDLHTTPFLGVGAAVGGLLGRQLFNMVASLFADKNTAGGVQACLLLFVTLVTLVYTVKKDRVASMHITSPAVSVFIGLILGMLGTFLGIGGGPFNVAALCLFFSMPTKQAAQNSLFIIMFSQIAGTLKTIFFDGTPTFDWVILLAMVLLGIVGSEMGRKVNRHLNNKQATLFLEGSMVMIVCINLYNIFKFFG